jgi:hypothetical protein
MSMPGFFFFGFRYACLPEAGAMFTRRSWDVHRSWALCVSAED